MKYLFVVLICSSTIIYGCRNNKNPNSSTEVLMKEIDTPKVSLITKDKLDDGFYLIINTWEDSSLISPSNGKVISFSHDFLDNNTNNQPIFIEVQTSDFVPLSLSKKTKRFRTKR